MQQHSEIKLFGSGFVIAFFAFLVLLIFGRDYDATWAIVLALVIAVISIIFLVLMLGGLPSKAAPTPKAETPVKKEKAPVKPAKVAPDAAAKYVDFKGKNYPVIDIEGIGPVYAERLTKAGVETTARMCYIGVDEVAKISKAPKASAQKWIAMAQLAKISGIGKQYAEALVRGGILSIEQLHQGDAQLLSGQVTTYLQTLDASVLGQQVSTKRIQTWQKKAKAMRKVAQPIPQL